VDFEGNAGTKFASQTRHLRQDEPGFLARSQIGHSLVSQIETRF